MMNIDYKKRVIILSFICAFVLIAIALTLVSLVQSLDTNDNIKEEKHLYATVKESGNNYIIVADLETNESYMFYSSDKYSEGDLLSIDYIDEVDSYTTKNIEIVAKKEDLDEIGNNEEVTTTKVTTTTIYSTSNPTYTTTNATNKTTSSKKVVTSTTTKVTTIKGTTKTSISNNPSDDDVVNYVKNEYEAYSTYEKEATLSEKAKNGFITIIDFIFYDGTIKGKKFNELTSAAKAKVIYYALLIDNKIDNKWPDYKETIKNKTSDLKAKLIAKYMDVTTTLCEKNSSACEVARSDLAILKGSLKLTWDVVVKAAKYGYGTITSILKNWYETWREK